ncbi:MAG: penicillin-binding protein activator LpoB [Bacteroidaceae bacterium]|nr:penicillin-binding protein activator LpoB [Bacteroidaceae bacterium]
MLKRNVLVLISIVVGILLGYPQIKDDDRIVVGVAEFSCKEASPYTKLVTEKVVEMLTNSKRFRVVDRTSRDKIVEELELQKTEAFIDSENLVEQDIAVAAEKMITGEIIKIPVYRMKNGDGSVRGYKASVAFQMKIVDVATGLSTEAASFEGKASQECLSPESAVTMAMTSMQDKIAEYFRLNFPVTAKVIKIINEKNGAAETILIKAGKKQGIKVGDKFNVESIEMIDGEALPTLLGVVTVTALKGEAFAECKADKKCGKVLFESFNAGESINCSLIIKNRL